MYERILHQAIVKGVPWLLPLTVLAYVALIVFALFVAKMPDTSCVQKFDWNGPVFCRPAEPPAKR